MTEAIRLRSRRSDATGVGPAVVVGIGYFTDRPYETVRRSFDYTPVSRRDGMDAGHRTGGAEQFRAFIERHVKPVVRERLPVDETRQSLFGHSLGGLFTLHTLLAAPSSFATYVAVSPSIWWDTPGLDSALVSASGRHAATLALARVLVTAGEYEQALAPWQRPDDMLDIARRRRERRMVDAAREMAERLASVTASSRFTLFAGEDHAATLSLSVSTCLRFCLAPAAMPVPTISARGDAL